MKRGGQKTAKAGGSGREKDRGSVGPGSNALRPVPERSTRLIVANSGSITAFLSCTYSSSFWANFFLSSMYGFSLFFFFWFSLFFPTAMSFKLHTVDESIDYSLYRSN